MPQRRQRHHVLEWSVRLSCFRDIFVRIGGFSPNFSHFSRDQKTKTILTKSASSVPSKV